MPAVQYVKRAREYLARDPILREDPEALLPDHRPYFCNAGALGPAAGWQLLAQLPACLPKGLCFWGVGYTNGGDAALAIQQSP